MDILTKALSALWQVAVVGILLGAGLPALFALGIRALAAGPATADGPSDAPAPPAMRAVAYLCFGLCILAVLFGIVVIVFGKQILGK